MGTRKNKDYFEGWYLKVVDNDNNSYAFIFGISLYKKDPHSFIQILNSEEGKSYYFRFAVEDFYYNKDSIRIKDNILGVHKINISVEQFDIDLNIEAIMPLKNGLFTKSIMCFFKYLPLPTYHEIVFMNSKVEGIMNTNDNNKMINGTGYMEKNYGVTFPKKWLWFQTNSFKNYNASLAFAKAEIGCLKGYFCILNVDNDEFRFATYNGFKLECSDNDTEIQLAMKKNDIHLEIFVKKESGFFIVGPIKKGKMERKIEESLTSTLTISLYKNSELIFHDSAINVGYENTYSLINNKRQD
jgi:hypothetical protein